MFTIHELSHESGFRCRISIGHIHSIFLDTFNSGHIYCIPGYIDSSKNSLNFHLIVFRDKVNFVLDTQQNCVHHRKIRFPNEVSTMNM